MLSLQRKVHKRWSWCGRESDAIRWRHWEDRKWGELSIKCISHYHYYLSLKKSSIQIKFFKEAGINCDNIVKYIFTVSLFFVDLLLATWLNDWSKTLQVEDICSFYLIMQYCETSLNQVSVWGYTIIIDDPIVISSSHLIRAPKLGVVSTDMQHTSNSFTNPWKA